VIPVVLIHNGYSEYLEYSIKQACRNNEVFLISDRHPNVHDDSFKCFDIKDYFHGFENFRLNYMHLNTTPYAFEVFCFYRWLILKNFMEKNDLDVVFYIDSDVMLYTAVEYEWANYCQFDMTLSHRTAAISSFMTLRGVTNFWESCENIYANKDTYDFQKIKSHFDIRQLHKLPGGVCDMTLFEHFHYNAGLGGGPGRIGEMMHIIDNCTYDHNINAEDQDFEMKNGIKHVKFNNTTPYVYNKRLKRNVLFNALHCQGGAKSLMKGFYDFS
jgi:hypothetical protein